MSKRPSFHACAYCGATGEITKDHILAQNLFESLKLNLITVPCCETCRRGTSDDDEYFTFVLIHRMEADGHPEVELLTPKVLRSLDKPEAAGLREAALNSAGIGMEFIVLPGGMYRGWAPMFRVEIPRLTRVGKRYIKGLFFIESGRRLPDTHVVRAFNGEALDRVGPAIRETLSAKCTALLADPPTCRGNDVFAYWCRREDADPAETMWVLEFFRNYRFMGATMPRSVADTAPP